MLLISSGATWDNIPGFQASVACMNSGVSIDAREILREDGGDTDASDANDASESESESDSVSDMISLHTYPSEFL